ncbi:MAG TPA: glycoside hydrolase family 76 protein [Gaiellaceae bacterium]|nr:glycoside hydrolase family 76 protein [Gaiellaceae bacterium]
MRVALTVAALAAVIVPFAADAPSGRADAALDARRALGSYAAMQTYLFDARTGRYREVVGGPAAAHAWPFSQALTAMIQVARLHSARAVAAVPARLRTLERLFRTGAAYAAWPGGDVYFDDDEWIAGALLDWRELRGDVQAQRRAAAVFALVAREWDGVAQHPCAGGIYWTVASGNRDRNTVTTANAALLALRLYGVTHAAAYLNWSRRLLAWLDTCMLGDNGLYRDHIALDGTVDATYWSYNQGLVIGALVELYSATGDPSVLARAEALADGALSYFGPRWSAVEPPEFAAIFFRQLLGLAAVDGRADYVAAAEGYGARAWSNARDPRTGLFAFGGSTRLLDQAALVQLYAALAQQRVTTGS